MAKHSDDSVFKRVERLGFRQIKPTPQHLLQSLPLASQQQRQEPGQLSSIHATDPSISGSGLAPAAAPPAARASSPQLQQLGQMKLSRNNSPPTSTLKALRASLPVAAQYNLLPPLISPNSPMCPGSDPPSPYLDVSTAATAFNSSQPRSPPSQQRRCCSPALSQQFPSCLSSYSTSRLRSSLDAGDRFISEGNGSAVDASAVAAQSSSLQRRGLDSAECFAVAVSTASSNPASAVPRQPLSPVAKDGAGQQLQRQRQPSAGQPPNINNSSNYAAAMNRARRRKPGWDDNTNLPGEPSFEDAISAWQQDMETGAYGPKFIGSWAAVSSGQLNSATAVDACGHTSSFKAGSNTGIADMPTVAFQGSGDEAFQTLESVVLKHLVGKPRLTLMQLQQGVLAISKLDSPFQLAAIGVLLRGGFWLAALQVAYADFAVLAEVLYEMKLVMETYLQWDSQLAAATWCWHTIDRDLFMRTFRGLDITVHYQKLRRQVYILQQLQHQSQQQLHAARMSPSTAGSTWASPAAAVTATGSYSSSGRGGVLHPQIATAEQQMLLSVLDHYLIDVDAALAAQATGPADGQANQRLVSVLEICPEAAEFTGSALVAVGTDVAAADISSGDAGTDYVTLRALQVSSNWRISARDCDATESAATEQQHQLAPSQTVSEVGCYDALKRTSRSSTSKMRAQQQPQTAVATAAKDRGFTGTDAASSKSAASKSSGHVAASGAHNIAAKSSSMRCSSGSSSSTQPPRQRTIAALDTFTIQSVPADAITEHVLKADAVLVQSPAASANKGRSSRAGSSSSPSAKANQLPGTKTSAANKSRQTPGGASRSRSATAAAGAAESGDKVAAHAQGQQQFSAFSTSVPAAEVLGMLEAQQQQQQQQVTDKQQPQQQADESVARQEGTDNSDQQHQMQNLPTKEERLHQLKGPALAAVPEPQQHSPEVEQQSEQNLTAVQQQQPQVLGQQLTEDDVMGHESVLEAVIQTEPEAAKPAAAAGCKQQQVQQQQQVQEMQTRQQRTSQETVLASVIRAHPNEDKPAPDAKLAHQPAQVPQQQQPQRQQQQPQQQQNALDEYASASNITGSGRPSTTSAVAADTDAKPLPAAAAAGAAVPKDAKDPTRAEPVKQEQRVEQELFGIDAAPAAVVASMSTAALDPTPESAAADAEPSSGQEQQVMPQTLSNVQAAVNTEPPTAASTLRLASAANAPIPQQKEQCVPQAPTSLCSRPQSHQTSRSNSVSASRPGSAGVFGRSGSISTAAGAGLLPQVGRPPSAAATAAAGGASTVPWSRPGSSGSSRMRPASAAGSSSLAAAAAVSSRPASAGGLSIARPASAGAYGAGADAVAASLQRLRESCAQQRRDIEQAAQTMMEAAASADARPGVDVTGVAAAAGASSSRPASPIRPGSSGSVAVRRSSDSLLAAAVIAGSVAVTGSVAASESRPSSALRSVGLRPSSSNNRPQLPVHCLSTNSSSRLQSPAGHLLGVPAELAAAAGVAVADTVGHAGTAEAELEAASGADGYMAVSMQLPQVPEESSRAVLSMDHSKEQVSTEEVQQQQQDGMVKEQQQVLRGEAPQRSLQGAAVAAFDATSAAAEAGAAGEAVFAGAGGAAPDQQQMQEELKVIMQMFQQRLELTALMAQQLLAQQKAGQAARRGSSNGRTGSAANSRPGSASVGTHRGSAAAAAGSAGSVSPAAADAGRSNVSGLDARSPTMLGCGGATGLKLTPHGLSALGVEEPPSAAEIAEYAVYLGMDPEQDADLLYIAESALTAPCPEGWTVHLDQDGNEFFYHPATQASTYEHPMDQHFRQLYQQTKREQQQL